jgi:hypothetical protein
LNTPLRISMPNYRLTGRPRAVVGLIALRVWKIWSTLGLNPDWDEGSGWAMSSVASNACYVRDAPVRSWPSASALITALALRAILGPKVTMPGMD